MILSSNQRKLLVTMKSLQSENLGGFCKCDIVLRQTLKSAGKYTDAAESVFSGEFEADPVACELYEDLLALIASHPDNPLAEGQGDLRLPAAPRYTECRITRLGVERLTSS